MQRDSGEQTGKKTLATGITISLATGGLLYATCRKSTLLYERLLREIPPLHWQASKPRLNAACEKALHNNPLKDAVIHSLPNALWTFSLCAFVEYNLAKSPMRNRRLRCLLYMCIALLPDLSQKMGILPGTYDHIDVLLATPSAILGALFSKIATSHRNH